MALSLISALTPLCSLPQGLNREHRKWKKNNMDTVAKAIYYSKNIFNKLLIYHSLT